MQSGQKKGDSRRKIRKKKVKKKNAPPNRPRRAKPKEAKKEGGVRLTKGTGWAREGERKRRIGQVWSGRGRFARRPQRAPKAEKKKKEEWH